MKSDKYEALTLAIRQADEAAREIASKTDDGGTCNLDTVFLVLPRYNEERVEAAAKAAGCSARKTVWMRTPGYFISHNGGGQADKRSAATEAMSQSLKANGFDSHVYYAMD